MSIGVAFYRALYYHIYMRKKTISDRLAEVILISRERNMQIYNKRKEGKTFEAIGKEFGLTRQRIQAICERIEIEKNK